MSLERQEIYCHGCYKHVQFDMDMGFDGNHRVDCPNCGHAHFRVVVGGKITNDRYDPYWANMMTMGMNVTSGTGGQMYASLSNSSCQFLADSWYDSTGG